MLQNILLNLWIGSSILELRHIHILQRELHSYFLRVDLTLGKQDNSLNVSGNWYQIDMTYAVTKRVINETTFAGCVSPLTYSQQSDTIAVSAVA